MSRARDIVSLASVEPAPVELPVINWSSIGHAAPTPHAKPHRQTSDALPAADVVMISESVASTAPRSAS